MFLFYVVIVEPLFVGVGEYKERVATARQDLSFMLANEAAVSAAATGGTPRANQPLSTLIDQVLRANQLTPERTAAAPDDGLRVRMNDMPFDRVVAALGTLQNPHGVTVASATFDVGEETGTVDVNVELRRGAP